MSCFNNLFLLNDDRIGNQWFDIFLVPPRISTFKFDDDISVGQHTQVMCATSQGDQPFQFLWLWNNEPLNDPSTSNGFHTNRPGSVHNHHNNYHYSSYKNNLTPNLPFEKQSILINSISVFSSILTINNVTANHKGNYTCLIKNIAGQVNHTAVLLVSGN